MTLDTQKIYYVYLLVDPAKKGVESIFYVGKGNKRRAESHLKENPKIEGEKHKKIQEIENRGQNVKIEILRHNLTEDEAIEVESSTIDLIGKENLTNKQYGHYKKIKGRCPYSQNIIIGAKELTDMDWRSLEKQGTMLVNLAQSYSLDLTAQELYDATRGWWKMADPRHKNIKYVLAIYNSIIQEVYEPVGWFKAGSTFMLNRRPEAKHKERWEFVGHLATDKIRKRYYKKHLGGRIEWGHSPFCYVSSSGRQTK